MGNLEEARTYLTAGAEGAKQLGSQKRWQEAFLLILAEPIEEQPVTLSDEHSAYAWISKPDARVWHPGHLEHAICAHTFINEPGGALLSISRPGPRQ